jgi:putative hydrolase of the HAD superfamily
VLFDLFNTLTSGNDAGRAETTYEMGIELGVDPQKFVWEFARSWPDRMSGKLGDMPAQCRLIARRIGGDPTDAQCEAAAELRYAFGRRAITPEPSTLVLLDTLRTAGLRLGVISNCTVDSSRAFAGSDLVGRVDTAVLSCDVGLVKPDPAIYELAARQLGLKPAQCAFVGDGADRELPGAVAVGMRVIQTRQYVHTDDTWAGEWVGRLDDLPAKLAVNGRRG